MRAHGSRCTPQVGLVTPGGLVISATQGRSTPVGNNEIYKRKYGFGPFLVHKLVGPRPPPPPFSSNTSLGGGGGVTPSAAQPAARAQRRERGMGDTTTGPGERPMNRMSEGSGPPAPGPGGGQRGPQGQTPFPRGRGDGCHGFDLPKAGALSAISGAPTPVLERLTPGGGGAPWTLVPGPWTPLDEQGEITGHGRPRSLKMVQSAEGEQGRDEREESLWLLEAPVRKTILQMHTPARTSQCWSRQTQQGLGVCIWMHLLNGTGNSPSPGRPTPGVVKQDKSSGGSVDTTKTRSNPQRVTMSSGQ